MEVTRDLWLSVRFVGKGSGNYYYQLIVIPNKSCPNYPTHTLGSPLFFSFLFSGNYGQLTPTQQWR